MLLRVVLRTLKPKPDKNPKPPNAFVLSKRTTPGSQDAGSFVFSRFFIIGQVSRAPCATYRLLMLLVKDIFMAHDKKGQGIKGGRRVPSEVHFPHDEHTLL